MERPNDPQGDDQEPDLSESDERILGGDLSQVHDAIKLREMFEFVGIVLNPKNPDAEEEEVEEDEED